MSRVLLWALRPGQGVLASQGVGAQRVRPGCSVQAGGVVRCTWVLSQRLLALSGGVTVFRPFNPWTGVRARPHFSAHCQVRDHLHHFTPHMQPGSKIRKSKRKP